MIKHWILKTLALFFLAAPFCLAHLELPRTISESRVIRGSLFSARPCAPSIGFQSYQIRLRELERSLLRDGFSVDKSRRVFYPAAAYDSAISLLFKTADVIAIDDHPAVSLEDLRDQKRMTFAESGEGGSYLRLANIHEKNYLGSRSLGGLIDSGYTIHEVTFFSVTGDVNRSSAIPNTHMMVRFNEGPRGPRRSFLQIQGTIPTSEAEARRLWWMNFLQGPEAPDVVIAKSANHSLTREKNPFLHGVALDWLEATHGIALEGIRTRSAHPRLGAGEISGGDIPTPVPPGVVRHRTYFFPGRFGYGDSVRALYF